MVLPKRVQNRLRDFNYSTPNAYFITICTVNRKNLFWKNVVATVDSPENVPLSNIGKILQQGFEEISKHYPSVTVDHYVIMPNHVHLLLRIHSFHNGRPIAAPTISSVINQTKGAITKRIGYSVWQKGFYDHVIRNENDYVEIWNYIQGNPGKWTEDELCVQT